MDEKPAGPPPNSPLPSHSKVTLYVGVPITLIILGIAVWALLSGMPFATDSKKLTRTEQPAPAVINEQSGATATTSEIRTPEESRGAGRGVDVISTTTTAAPAGIPTAPPPQTTTWAQTVPAPPPIAPPPARSTATRRPPPAAPPEATAPPPAPSIAVRRPPPAAPAPQTSPAATTSEITESQAEDVLRNFVTSRDYYQVGSADCIGTVTQGYKNRGYAIDVVDRCGDRGRLGRWRVDSLTREVFVQRSNGKYLRP